MEFQILGPLEVHGERGVVGLEGLKPRAVLAVLLLHANEPVSAERLAVALWGEDAPVGAVKTVQVHVSRLRKALGDPEAVITTPAGYRLRVRPGELDAERFARGVAQGRRALEAGDPERAGVVLREALGLWHGPALADLEFEPFAAAEIARLEEQRLVALEARVEADLARGSHGALVSELQQLRAEHPTRERLVAQLMLALYRSGRQAEALEVYRDARQILVEDAGVEPGAELQRLHAAILRQDPSLDLPTSAVPLPSELDAAGRDVLVTPASDRRSALPASPNRTIGRGREVGLLADRLRAGSVRLLTLTGPGGVGKTRLALEAARAVEADFPNGARFVSLAAIARPQDVPPAIVSSLGIVPLAGETAEQAVERFLAAKHLLLVVDNCEHLPRAAPFIGGLAVACPTVTVLATSREPLAVQAEQCFPVSPLALPEPGPEDPAVMAGVDAVALFRERARAHEPDFELSEMNASAVAAICRRLDGLPLAIELAAARCGLLSPAEIATRLDGALHGLGAAPRDAPARQQTLRATIDWSHNLLSADEKACFARFAVFAGGATVQAAEIITGAVIDTLDRLVAKSLLVRRHIDGRTRLAMLETVRAYAAARFAAIPGESVRERHFGYFHSLAVRHGPDWAVHGPSSSEHLAALDREIENLRAALQWAVERDTTGDALAMSSALIDYWMMRDRYAEAVYWVELALQKSNHADDPAVRARALCRMCWPLWAVGRAVEGPALLTEAEAIARTLWDPLTLAFVLYNRAALMSFSGKPDVAAVAADEALACAKASGDSWTIAMAAWARAKAARSADELRDRVDEAASLLEQVGNAYQLATLFHDAAGTSLRRGWDGDATVYLQRAVPLIRQLDHPYQWMLVRGNVGVAELLAGDTEAAHDAFREELTLGRELVVSPAASGALTGLAAVAALDNELERAARLAGAAAAHRHGEPQDPVDARLDATILEPARTRCGADAWDAALREGTALSFEDAIAYALDEPNPQAANPATAPSTPAGQAH
jgi:predicted ATPase/DNA-binding SARP family transcriptional activator